MQDSVPFHQGHAGVPNRSWILWGLLILVALALRLPGFTESVWIDELYTSRLFCGHPLVLAKTLYSDIHPPAYFVFIHYWISIFGDSVISLRLPPLLFGLGSLILVQRLGRLWFSERAGWWAAWALAISPVHIWYSQEARPYSANLFLALACFLLHSQMIRSRPRLLAWLLFTLVLSLTTLGHYYLVVLPASFALAEIVKRSAGWKSRLSASVIALGLVGLVVVGKLYFSELPTEKGYLRHFDALEAWKLLFVWFPSGLALAPRGSTGMWGATLHGILPFLWAAFFSLGCWAAWRPPTGRTLQSRWALVGFIALPALLLGLPLLGFGNTYIERSALPALPFVVLLMAAGADRVLPNKAWSISLPLLPLLIILGAFFARRDLWTVYKPNPAWQQAGQFLAQELQGDSEIRIYSDYLSPSALTYYDERFQEVKNFDVNVGKIEKLFARLQSLPGSNTGFGQTLSAHLQDMLGDFEDLRQQAIRGTRASIFELRVIQPDLQQPAPHGIWLLVHHQPSSRAVALLESPGLKVLRQKNLPSLQLYELTW
ncbi:MAG: hypothetical protein GY930_17790 [bacterium]|nr:hypothetical protein [bacterium]